MRTLTGNYKKTILGYHDKHLNRIGLINVDQLPILVDENFSPFLVTRDQNFTISTPQVATLLENAKTLSRFRRIKTIIANILVVPGLIISLLFALKLIGLLDPYESVKTLISNKLVNLTFWLSVLGIITLWHDYYRTRSHPIKLPVAYELTDTELADIKANGFRFTRYAELSAVHFLNETTQIILSRHYEDGMFKTYDGFVDLLDEPRIEELLARADMKLSREELASYNIDANTMPDYQVQALRSILIYALDEAILTSTNEIKPEHVFLAYMSTFPILKSLLQQTNTPIELLREVVRSIDQEEYKERARNAFSPFIPYQPSGGYAKDWIYGYTFVLNHFSRDLNLEIANTPEKYGIGHEKEVESIISIIGRLSKKSILLIGEPGVGKSSLIQGLAQRINKNQVPIQLKNKRIIQLDITRMMSLANSTKDIGSILQKSMGELEKAGNTILYIDEIQELIPAKSEESGQSIAGIMLPYILEGKFPIIGTINYADYKKYFYANESLRQSFEIVEVAELSAKDTLYILESQIPTIEKNFGLFVTYPALLSAIELSQRYITNRRLPDSAVRTLEGACSWAQAQKLKTLTSEHVAKYISVQTKVPVENIGTEEAAQLMNLENEMKKQVIGQDEAVHVVVETLKRARTDIRDPKKPIGVFLFLGPTGTGKTHLAKALSNQYFGAHSDMIKIDMSEYQEVSSINKFIGVSAGDNVLAQTTITLLDRVKANPYSVVLFDEIEKAHPNVLDLFLQLFDEGRLTSNTGETVNFTNTILICTSNIGSKIIMDALSKDRSLWNDVKDRALIELKGALRPELLNRFDNVVVFAPHDEESLTKIADILLNDLAKRVGEKGIKLAWGKTIANKIAQKNNVPEMGARPLRRFIQEKVEGRIATELLSGTLTKGNAIEVKESWLG